MLVYGVDLRTRTSLFCGVLALAIAASILLRGRPRRAQVLFAALLYRATPRDFLAMLEAPAASAPA